MRIAPHALEPVNVTERVVPAVSIPALPKARIESGFVPPGMLTLALHVVVPVHINGISTPLNVIVFTLTGAVPVSVMGLVVVLIVVGPFTENGALTVASCDCRNATRKSIHSGIPPVIAV